MKGIYFQEKGIELLDRRGITKAEFARRMGIQRQNVNVLFQTNNIEIIIQILKLIYDLKMFNKSLNDYIHVKYISVNETAGHASLRYLSSLAVLQLDAILPNAILKQNRPVNPKTKNQKGFKRMLIMEYLCPAIGLVRLTVGQKSSDDSKVQYCITAIEVS